MQRQLPLSFWMLTQPTVVGFLPFQCCDKLGLPEGLHGRSSDYLSRRCNPRTPSSHTTVHGSAPRAAAEALPEFRKSGLVLTNELLRVSEST